MAHQVSRLRQGYWRGMGWSLLPGLVLLPAGLGLAQEPIVPAQDRLNTQVVREGDRWVIQGGQLSGDRGNLFHGFDRFNVPTGAIADFQGMPELRNIFGRISGGEPSLIDGTIQVSGGTPNLFLLNPAGAVFGPNSQLNVPASFHFSTANQVQFGAGLEWEMGASASRSLVSVLNGDPTGFGFGTPASLINFGTLAVVPGAELGLLGGTVLNAGTLSAPGGTVTLAAAEPGRVRLSRVGGILNLEFQAAAIAPTGVSPQTLPELLTGSGLAPEAIAHGVTVDDTTGTVTLGQTRVAAAGGTAIAGGSLSASSTTGTGGTVNVLGDRVAVAGGSITATGPEGGGLLQVGGGFQGQGSVWNAQDTSVDPVSTFDVSATQAGPGGTAIAWADGNTWFEGTAMARGGPWGGDGGLVETSGLTYLDASRAIVDAGSPLGTAGRWLLDPGSLTVTNGGPQFNVGTVVSGGTTEYSASSDPALIPNTTIEATLNGGTDVTLQATDDITVAAPINKTAGGDATLQFVAGNQINIEDTIASTAGRLTIAANAGGAIALANNDSLLTNGGSVTFNTSVVGLNLDSRIETAGGNLVITADNFLQLNRATLITAGGNVALRAGTAGTVSLTDSVLDTEAGNITFNGGTGAPSGGHLALQGTRLQTTSGDISLSGAGISTNGPGVGIQVQGATLQTDTGAITLTGIGSTDFVTANSNGLEIIAGTSITGGGPITLVGTGDLSGTDTSTTNQGVLIRGSIITATGPGLLSITGTAGTIAAADHLGQGVAIDGGTTLNGGDGGLSITGTGTGTGSDLGHGIDLFGTITATGNGNITLTGTGTAAAAADDNHGIFIHPTGLVQVENGTATLVGTAQGTGDSNSGVVLAAGTGPGAATVEATGTGNVTLDGHRGNGNNDNTDVLVGGKVQVQGGTAILRSVEGNATPRTGDENDGVVITGPMGLVSTSGGTIAITGTSAAGVDSNRGIVVEDEIVGGPLANTGIAALNGGRVTLNGTSTGTGTLNIGVEIGGNVTVGNGTAVEMTGTSTAGAIFADGVLVLDSGRLSVLTPSSTGAYTLTGTGAAVGVKVQSPMQTVDGNITITGVGGDTGVIFENTVETTGAGSVRVTGTRRVIGVENGANGDGIAVTDGGVARATGTGDAVFVATGTGTGIDFNVPMTGSSANTGLYSLTTARNLEFSTDRNFTGSVFLRSLTGNVSVQNLTSAQGTIGFVSDAGNIAYQDLNGASTITLTANQGAIAGTSIVAAGNTLVRAQNAITTSGAMTSDGYDARSEGDRFQGSTITSTGPVRVFSNHDLTVGNITAAGNSVHIESRAGQVTAGNISTTAATGGDITVLGQTQITSGFLNARGTTGDGGDVVVDPVGDIVIPWIDASGGASGTGGDIFVETTGGDLRFTGLVPGAGCSDSSLCTTSGSRVDLRHGGASPTFEVGDPSTNGSLGSLTNGTSTIPTGLSLLSTPSTSFGDGGVSVTPGEILTPIPTPEIPDDPTEVPADPEPVIADGPDVEAPIPVADPDPTPELPEVPADPTPTPDLESPRPVPDTPSPSPQVSDPPLISLDLGEWLKRSLLIQNLGTLGATDGIELFPKSTDRTDPVSVNFSRQIQAAIASGDIAQAIAAIDALRRYEFATYAQDEITAGIRQVDPQTVPRAQDLMQIWEERTRQRYAILYTLSYPDRLELLLITRDGEPVHRVVPGMGQLALSDLAGQLRGALTNPLARVQQSAHLPAAEKLYDAIIRPVRDRLELDNIDSIIFSLSSELRSTPLAALHDGDRYLIESYNFTILPFFDAIDSRQQLERGSGVLAMGASQFQDPQQSPLPFVPIELDTITQKSWEGKAFLNNAFNLENFLEQRHADPSAIVHLATHAEFRGGAPDKSYIQFGTERIGLDDLGRLQLGSPVVNLLVLSACRTALGNPEAELGFAGLSVKSGVRTAIASLWYVNDAATSVLMGQFYRHWADGDIVTKSTALQRAQVAMLNGDATIKDGNLIVEEGAIVIPLPPALHNTSITDLRHPYYWAAFTTIGSPW